MNWVLLTCDGCKLIGKGDFAFCVSHKNPTIWKETLQVRLEDDFVNPEKFCARIFLKLKLWQLLFITWHV